MMGSQLYIYLMSFRTGVINCMSYLLYIGASAFVGVSVFPELICGTSADVEGTGDRVSDT